MHDPAPPRTIEVPAALLAQARAALENQGTRRGAEQLGISRNALISVVATGRAMPGTVALMRERASKVA